MLLRLASTIVFVLCVVFPTASWASLITIDFETLSDVEVVTTQFDASHGVTFENATALTAFSVGGSLFDSEFPPASGDNVVFDIGGPMTVVFSTPVSSFSARFTYSTALTLEAFDSSNTLLGSIPSQFTENFTSSGNPSNEFLQLSFAGISKIVIVGSPGGESFAMDDLCAVQGDVPGESCAPVDVSAVVPEPASFVLVLTGLSGLIVRRRMKRGGIAPQALP